MASSRAARATSFRTTDMKPTKSMVLAPTLSRNVPSNRRARKNLGLEKMTLNVVLFALALLKQ